MDKSQCMFLFFFIILVNSLFGNNNEIMDRRNRFINEGFGFEYNTEDSENIELKMTIVFTCLFYLFPPIHIDIPLSLRIMLLY